MVHWMTGSYQSKDTQNRSVQQDHLNNRLKKVTLVDTKPENTVVDDYLTSQLLATQNDWFQNTSQYMLQRLETALLLERRDYQLKEQARWEQQTRKDYDSTDKPGQPNHHIERQPTQASQRRLRSYRVKKPKKKRRSTKKSDAG